MKALTIRNRVKAIVNQTTPSPRAVLFDAAAQDKVDLTSTEMIKGLVKDLHGKGIEVHLADVHAPVLEVGIKTGLRESISKDHLFPTVDAAERFLEGKGSAGWNQ